MSQQTDGSQASGRHRMKLKWVGVALLAAAAVLLVVLLSVFLGRDGDTELQGSSSDTPETFSGISYDFSELPAGSGPGDIESASYVSILLTDSSGQVTSYGLSSSIPAAQALIEAVRGAERVDAAAASPSTTAPGAAGGTGDLLRSTLTFLLPDRTTLTFELYVEQGLVARGDSAWRTDGDLAALVEAAVAAGEQ